MSGRRLGQHFLRDRQVLAAMVAAIAPAPGDCFVEVGPGQGVLTRPLLAAGATVVAVELDGNLAAGLAQRMGDLAARLQVVRADAARMLPNPAGRWRLVGNLPYAISSPLLTRLCDRQPVPVDVHVMVQREFAARLAAGPGSRTYGRLSVAVQARFIVEELFDVPPGSFTPPPQVRSSVVRLRPAAAAPIDADAFARVLRHAFGQRRKRLATALAPLGLMLDDARAAQRAEELGVADYVRLAAELAAAEERR